jgi:hypothetical protein
MATISDPEIRSPVASTVNVTLVFAPVLAFAVTEIRLGLELITGASSGLRLPTSKVTVAESNSSFDKFFTSALIVSGTCLLSAEISPVAEVKMRKIKSAVIPKNFLSISVSKNGKKDCAV